MALDYLSAENVVDLDDERKAVRNHESDSHSRKGRKAKNPVVEDSFSLLAGHSGSFKSSNKKF